MPSTNIAAAMMRAFISRMAKALQWALYFHAGKMLNKYTRNQIGKHDPFSTFHDDLQLEEAGNYLAVITLSAPSSCFQV